MLTSYTYWPKVSSFGYISLDSLDQTHTHQIYIRFPIHKARAMAAQQSLTKYNAGEAQANVTTPGSNILVTEEQVQTEAWNALYREHQRFRHQIVQMNATAFNNNRAYQQLIHQFNKARNDLAHSHQTTAVLQADLDQQRAIVDFGKRQMEMATNALQQEMESRLRAQDGHREETKNVQTLVAMITRLTHITTEELEMILGDEVDVYAILNDPQIAVDGPADQDGQLRQISFTLQCYKDRTSQLRGQNERLFQMVEEKEAELKTLKADFDQDNSEDENTPEEQENSH